MTLSMHSTIRTNLKTRSTACCADCLQAGVKLDLRGPNEDEGTVLTAKDLIEELAYGQGVITTVEEICDKVERELNGDDGQFQPDVPMPTIPDDRAMSL